MTVRKATHAGTWYTENADELDLELSSFLASVQPGPEENFSPPIKGNKAIIAPHAGYSYSGPAAAWAYKSIDTTGIKRVFILGPSHHVYLNGCDLSICTEYATPLGNLPLDLDTIKELRATGKFGDMSRGTDEDEHSIEMHLSYVRKIFEGIDITIVPILVGGLRQDQEVGYGNLLAPYLARDDTFCVISSDFCHWGTRFRYTYYYPEPPPSQTPAIRLSASNLPKTLTTHPIHASITVLDHEAMELTRIPPHTPSQAHDEFTAYLEKTKNTICGRHPIGVLLATLVALKETHGKEPLLRWVRYEQSSQCVNIKDSSVSYASAYVTF